MTSRRPVQDLSDLIRVLWRHRYSIIAATLVAAAVAAVFTMVLPVTYRARATLMINESKFGDSAGASVYFNPRLFHTFTGIITRHEALNRALAEFPDLREREISVDDLAQAVKVELISNSRLMTVSLVLDDPQLAANVVNFISRQAEEHTQTELYEGETAATRRRLEPELQAAQDTLMAAQRRLDEATALGTDTALEHVIGALSEARQLLVVDRAPLAATLEAQRRERAEGVSFEDRLRETQEARSEFRQRYHPESREHLRDTLFLSRRSLIHRIASAEVEYATVAGALRGLRGVEMERDSSHGTWGGFTTEIYTAGMGAHLSQRLAGIESEISQARETLQAIESSAEAVQQEFIWIALQDELLEDDYDLLRLQQANYFELPYLQFPYETLVGMVAAYDEQIAQLDAQIEEALVAGGRALTLQTTALSEVTVAEEALTSLQTSYSEAAMRLEERQVALVLLDAATAPTHPHFPNRKMLTTLAAMLALLFASLTVVVRENLLATGSEIDHT